MDIIKYYKKDNKEDDSKILKKQDHLVRKMIQETALGFILLELTGGITYIVDGFMISRFLGDAAFAASGMTGLCYSVVAIFAGVISTGVASICSKEMSQGNMAGANKAFSLAINLILFSMMILLTVGVAFADPIATILGAPLTAPTLHHYVKVYIQGFFLGAPAQAMLAVLIPQIQLDGGSARIKRSVILLSITDIVGDFVNVFVIDGGMFGMALATTISYYVAVIVLLGHFKSDKAIFLFSIKLIDFSYIKQMFKVGLPLATKRIGNILRPIVLNRVILATGGAYAMSAYTTQLNFRTFPDSLGMGFGAAIYLITAMFVGEKDKTSTKQTFLSSVHYILVFILPIAIIYYIMSPFIARIYNDPGTDFFTLSVFALRMHAVSLPFLAFNEIFNNYIQALEKIKMAHLLTFLSRFVYICLTTIILSHFFGINGLFIALPVSEIALVITIVVITY
ncbi:MAG: hypothetical protein K5656_08775, partial [Lachnospiraceae bacterium]|nr:hypothetical protein [Lachnospiraceae bacterium]